VPVRASSLAQHPEEHDHDRHRTARRSRRVPGVRQLPSGRWQVRITDPAGLTRTLGVYDSYDQAVVERVPRRRRRLDRRLDAAGP